MLLIILVWSEKNDMEQQVVLLLGNAGMPSEQHYSPAVKKHRHVRPSKPKPPIASIPPLQEKPLAVPPPTTVSEPDEPSAPPETASPSAVEPNPNTSDAKEEDAVDHHGKNHVTDSDSSQASREPEISQAEAQGYLDGHFTYLRELIIKRIKYPWEAKKRGYTGRVTVSFIILESGSVTDITVISSSGHRILDENVLQTVRELGALPKPPVRVQIVLPISYSLD